MTTYAKGMDPEVLKAIAGRIRGAKGDVDAVQEAVSRAMDRAGQNWGGGDLEALMAQYRGTCAPALDGLGANLHDLALRIERNARAQRDSSLENRATAGPAYSTTASGERWWSKTNTDDEGRKHTRTAYGPFTRYDVEHTTGAVDDPDGERTTTDTRGVVGRHGPEFYTSLETSTKHGTVDDNGEHSVTKSYRESELFGQREREWGRQQTASHAWGENTYEERKSPDIGWGKDVSVKIASGDIEGWNSSNFAHHIGDEKNYAETMGTTTTGTYDVSIKDGNLVAGGAIGAGAYALRAHAQGGDRTGFAQGGGQADFSVGADAKAQASASIGKDGLNAGAHAEAFAGAKGSAGADGSLGVAHGSVGAHAMAGAEAAANASVGIGVEGAKVSADVDAFAGAKAGVDASAGVSGVTGNAGAEVYAGIGGHAKVDVQANLNHIKADVNVGAAVGVGAGVKFSVDVEPQRIINDVAGAAGQVAGVTSDLQHGAHHVGQSVGRGIEDGFNSLFGR